MGIPAFFRIWVSAAYLVSNSKMSGSRCHLAYIVQLQPPMQLSKIRFLNVKSRFYIEKAQSLGDVSSFLTKKVFDNITQIGGKLLKHNNT